MVDPVWTNPEAYPVSPTIETEEGYIEYSGYASDPVYVEADGIRQAKQIIGCNFIDPATLEPAEDAIAVEAGRFNDLRRVMYNSYKRLWFLAFLAEDWPYGYGTSFLRQGVDSIGPNFCHRWEFEATGRGKTITLYWTPGGANSDARQLSRAANGNPSIPIHPGCVAMDQGLGLYGLSVVTNGRFIGEVADGKMACEINLHRPLDAGREGKIWIVVEEKLPPFPSFALFNGDRESLVCKYAVETFHDFYSSFKTHNPSAAASAGIYQTRYCSKLDQSGVDLSLFQAAHGLCPNIDCPYYTLYGEWYPEDGDAFSKFWLARGRYDEEVAAGAAVSLPDNEAWKVGRDHWQSLLAMCGVPIGYWCQASDGYDVGGSVFLARKMYSTAGLVWRTGEKKNNQDVFRNWWQEQLARVADGDDETDKVGLLADYSAVTKRDPAGGAAPGSRTLTSDRPGYDFERIIGNRRIGEIGLSEMSTVTGEQIGMVQRARARKYTSARFAYPYAHPDGYLANDNGETLLAFYSTPQALGTLSAFHYNLAWQIPRFGETVRNPTERKTKTISATIAAAYLEYNVLRLDFELGALPLIYGGSLLAEPTEIVANCGGNVVRSEISQECLNMSAGRKIGDRQAGLYPGDTITFDADAVRDVTITCIRAEAYGGSTGTGTAPVGAAPGVGAWIEANWNKRDRAWFALEGKNGETIKSWIDAGGLDAAGVAIDNVMHSAVAPPTFNYLETANGYAPTLQRVQDGATVSTLTAGTDYVFDPNTGIFYIDASGWPEGHSWNLHFVGNVFDTRKLYACEDAKACDSAISAIINNDGYIDAGAIWGGQQFALCRYNLSTGAVDALDATFYAPVHDPLAPESFDSVLDAEPGWDTSLQDLQWRKYNWTAEGYGGQGLIGDTSAYIIGSPSGFDGYHEGYVQRIAYQHRGWMFTFTPPKRFGKEQIKTALMDIDLGSAGSDTTIYECAYAFAKTGQFTYTETGTETAVTESQLCLALYRLTLDEADANRITSMEPLAKSSLATVAEVVTDGDKWFRATVDITDLLKLCYDYYWALSDNQELAIILSGDNTVGEAVSVQETIQGWVSGWNATYDPTILQADSGSIYPSTGISPGGFTTFNKSCKRIQFNGIVLGSVMIQPDPDALDVCNYPVNADEHTHGPSLM